MVKVDVEINGLDEAKEESEGAYLAYVADTNGVMTAAGTNAMVGVKFTCAPADLPPDEMVTIENKGHGELYMKEGEALYLVTTTNIPACQIGRKTFLLHGHRPSMKICDGSIIITHNASKAKDCGRYTIYGVEHYVDQKARRNKDPSRTKLGVGECVFISALPRELFESWQCSHGKIFSENTASTWYDAPGYAAIDTIVATFKNQKTATIPTLVVEPQSYFIKLSRVEKLKYKLGMIGSGMVVPVDICPLDVSFYRVRMMELPRRATNIYGDFANTNLFPNGPHDHDKSHGAGSWVPFAANRVNDLVELYGLNSIHEDSGYSWPIPAVWKVFGPSTSPQKPLVWSDESFYVKSNAVTEVSKFSLTAIRGTNVEESVVRR